MMPGDHTREAPWIVARTWEGSACVGGAACGAIFNDPVEGEGHSCVEA
jgi:hypothetical protein